MPQPIPTRRRARRYSLRWTLVLYVVLPLLLALAGGGVLALRALEWSIERRMQEDVQLVARAIRQPVSRALENRGARSVARTLESAFRIDRVYGVYVYDDEGRAIAAAARRGPDEEPERLAELAAQGDREGEYGRVGGRRVYSYFVPLLDGSGRSNGLLQITRRRSDFDEYIQQTRLQAAGLLGLAVVLVTGLVVFGHHGSVGRHLERLARAMGRVGAGERGHRAAAKGPREIAAVAGELNDMLDNLGAAERELERKRREQRELESRLRHAEKLAALGRLAAGVAHELGTPLSVLDGQAQRLLRRIEPRSRTESGLREMRAQVGRMEAIVRQLLDFGRAHRPRFQAADAERVARAALDVVRDRARESGTRLAVSAPATALRLRLDPPRVERALVNLLENAIDAAPGGRVEIGWFRDGDEAGYVVDDDGPGVPEEAESKVFEPFFTTKGVGEGTGLGLAVVHGVAEEHGGRAEVGESPSGGARFRLVLPVEEGSRDD